MGLLSRRREKREQKKQAKQKITYDVNAPINEYSKDQIRARIRDELGQSAVGQFSTLAFNSQKDENKELLYHNGLGVAFSLGNKFFLNDFFKQAIILKAKQIIKDHYIALAKFTKEVVSLEEVKNMVEKVELFVESKVELAKQEEEILAKNKEEGEKIEEYFKTILP